MLVWVPPMPSSTFAAIFCDPQQVKGATFGLRKMGLVVLLKPYLGNASSSRAYEFAVRLIVSSILPSQSERGQNFALGDSEFQSPPESAYSTPFPSNTPNEPRGFHTSFRQWKAAALLLFARGAAALFLAFAIRLMASAFERRYCLGGRACRP